MAKDQNDALTQEFQTAAPEGMKFAVLTHEELQQYSPVKTDYRVEINQTKKDYLKYIAILDGNQVAASVMMSPASIRHGEASSEVFLRQIVVDERYKGQKLSSQIVDAAFEYAEREKLDILFYTPANGKGAYSSNNDRTSNPGDRSIVCLLYMKAHKNHPNVQVLYAGNENPDIADDFMTWGMAGENGQPQYYCVIPNPEDGSPIITLHATEEEAFSRNISHIIDRKKTQEKITPPPALEDGTA